MARSRTDGSPGRPAYHHGDLRRALVDAAVSLLAETQRWDFSLREVARRAEVSHNAPYGHFADKRDLLAAVATAGHETLRMRMLAASAESRDAPDALSAIGQAYLRFGIENPAYYRLMFGQALREGGGFPLDVLAAAAASRSVLRDVVKQGIPNGSFKIAPGDETALAGAVLAAWSLVHGLTLLHIDGLAGLETSLGIDQLAEMVSNTLMTGLGKTTV